MQNTGTAIVLKKELNGEIVEYEINLWATSNVFLPGHRILLEISSSSFPQYAPQSEYREINDQKQ
ncbi:CocE/NonD family hydrolase C-terminal non-catalytic domain-containing protein [Peribacillus frigoritolerans]|nr:CocE/NonD family hydrolase C-terminal non-catalytic domain-containing protein [Peribacillus frigoritolerans]